VRARSRAKDRGVSAENITAGCHSGRIFRPEGLPTAREATADRKRAASTEYELKSVALILHLAMAALEDSSGRSNAADFVKNGRHPQPGSLASD
jgi:pyruvate/2-oxoglutarate dehydrogenase complex dihydrolipoamide acyltransferase (E2) component